MRIAVQAVALAAIANPMAVGPVHAQQRDQIRIVGSSTVYPFTTAVAENFARASQFNAPIVEATGTGGGFKLFCSGVGPGTPDIVNASRPITMSELDACREAGVSDVTEVKIGYDGVVLGASEQAEPLELTLEDLYLAVAKQVPQDGSIVGNPYRTWSEINEGLPATPIRIFGPPPTSGTRDAFVELVMEEACEGIEVVQALPENRKKQICAEVREDAAFVQAGENDNLIVQKLQADPEARGIFGFSFLDQNEDVLQAASIEGVEPTFEGIAAGEYPLARPLYIYVKNAHVDSIPGLRDFVQEYVGEAAAGEDGYLADKGLIPLPEDEAVAVREQAISFTPVQRASTSVEEATPAEGEQ